MFDPPDVERGYFRATDREGQEVEVPLVTLSVAVGSVRSRASVDHPRLWRRVAASLKRQSEGR